MHLYTSKPESQARLPVRTFDIGSASWSFGDDDVLSIQVLFFLFLFLFFCILFHGDDLIVSSSHRCWGGLFKPPSSRNQKAKQRSNDYPGLSICFNVGGEQTE